MLQKQELSGRSEENKATTLMAALAFRGMYTNIFLCYWFYLLAFWASAREDI